MIKNDKIFFGYRLLLIIIPYLGMEGKTGL
jgi:hypothetical protein